MRYLTLIISIIFLALPLKLQAMDNDDPWLTKTSIDKLELGNHNVSQLEADIASGKDLHKLWLSISAEQHKNTVEDLSVDAYYHQAITAFWNLQVGASRDFEPKSPRNWLVFGVKGLAPYNFDIDAHIYVAEHGQTKLEASAEYEILLTQYWVLVPEIEATVFSKNEAERGIGKGLSTIEAGIRLRYEINRNFAPYIGVNFEKAYGNTASFMKDSASVEAVAGLWFWF